MPSTVNLISQPSGSGFSFSSLEARARWWEAPGGASWRGNLGDTPTPAFWGPPTASSASGGAQNKPGRLSRFSSLTGDTEARRSAEEVTFFSERMRDLHFIFLLLCLNYPILSYKPHWAFAQHIKSGVDNRHRPAIVMWHFLPQLLFTFLVQHWERHR